MNPADIRRLLQRRCDAFNAQLVAVNDELAALHARERDLERALLDTMGRKNEAAYILSQWEDPDHAADQPPREL